MWSKCAQIGKFFSDLSNPVVGKKILQLQKTSILVRVDGRSLEVFSKQDGLIPRVELNHVVNVRHTRVERYQKFNEDPFGWGACTSLKDLKVFIEQNKSHTQNAWIHKFYGKATSLAHLKLETGMETEGHDDEKEEIIVEHVPFKHFLASTCPKYRDKFLQGGLVPNAMALYNPDLPKSMRINDLFTEADVLSWLLINNSEKTFEELCRTIYTDVSKETLTIRFDGNGKLIDAIDSVLATAKSEFQI